MVENLGISAHSVVAQRKALFLNYLWLDGKRPFNSEPQKIWQQHIIHSFLLLYYVITYSSYNSNRANSKEGGLLLTFVVLFNLLFKEIKIENWKLKMSKKESGSKDLVKVNQTSKFAVLDLPSVKGESY